MCKPIQRKIYEFANTVNIYRKYKLCIGIICTYIYIHIINIYYIDRYLYRTAINISFEVI